MGEAFGRGLRERVSSGSCPKGGTPTSHAASNQCDLPPALFPLARREAKDGGLTVVVDARKQPPVPVLFAALRSVQVHQAPRSSAMDLLGGGSLPGSEYCHPLGALQSLPCACRPVQSPDSQQLLQQPPALPCLGPWFLSCSQILPINIVVQIYRGSSRLPAAGPQCTDLEHPCPSCCFLPRGQSWLPVRLAVLKLPLCSQSC